ncbi:uncharacterized protein VTP21DRAFT_10930 [Calcarisporiella thermophila]|uniref:uncharacterized protein n=1 Tax=Calcarisporiella thermophila TaxID=911321 RepID=UPI00374215E0
MSNLQEILDRLVAENLHGPLTSFSGHSLRKPASGGSLFGRYKEDGDLDGKDPRWLELFTKYFVENADSRHDDMLFFVRQPHAGNDGEEPVFVKRRQANNQLPPVDDLVLWKETFYLNLIVQLPCKLTVAVCRRVTENDKTSMMCSRKHVSKRVYALPTKSRVDMKESRWECSYPLIYYVIDDYEDMFANLVVKEGEYLCVELAVTIPHATNTEDLQQKQRRQRDKSGNHHELDDSGDEEDEEDDGGPFTPYGLSGSSRASNKPFPQPSATKITLFQGAASYSAMLDIYRQKSVGKSSSRRFHLGSHKPSTEYIMMRGPGGKGHAQVAITAFASAESPDVFHLPSSEGDGYGRESPVPQHPEDKLEETGGEPGDRRRSILHRSNSAGSLFQSLKRLSLSSLTERHAPEPNSLKCCMTFVNVPWQSIISDLLTYARKRPAS